MIIYRTAFDEIQGSTVLIWFSLDYLADFIYLMDILIHFRTGMQGSWGKSSNFKTLLPYRNGVSFVLTSCGISAKQQQAYNIEIFPTEGGVKHYLGKVQN